MRPRGIGRLKGLSQRAVASLRSRVVILAYHRVFEASSDPWLLHVSPKHFNEHLEHLHRHYRVMNLRSLSRALRDGRLPRRGVVVTFDDGHIDNLWNAKPLLECYGIPSTLFVTTGDVGLNREFWWDELERLLLLTPLLPERLQVRLNDTVYEWKLGDMQGWEMAESKRRLETMLGQEVTTFCYPYGG